MTHVLVCPYPDLEQKMTYKVSYFLGNVPQLFGIIRYHGIYQIAF